MSNPGIHKDDIDKVLSIAREIIESGAVLNIKKLIRVVTRELRFTRRYLTRILDFLLGNSILVEGTTFTRNTVLENGFRRIIMEMVEREQVVNFSLLREELGKTCSQEIFSSGQLLWHLNLLLKFKHLKRVKLGKKTLFACSNLGDGFIKASFLLRDPIILELASVLHETKEITKAELVKAVKSNRDKVYYRLKVLQKEGFISTTPRSKSEQVSMSAILHEALLHLLKEQERGKEEKS